MSPTASTVFREHQHPRDPRGQFVAVAAPESQLDLSGPAGDTTTAPEADPARRTSCVECGDARGWRAEPDPGTGEPMQVECRACYEFDASQRVEAAVPAYLVASGAEKGLDAHQVADLHARALASLDGKSPPDPARLSRDWSSFCRSRAARTADPDLAAEYRSMAAAVPDDTTARAAMDMNRREQRATKALAALSAATSAERGVSRRDVDAYVDAARAQYLDELADLPEHERPDPPAEWVTGLTTRCWEHKDVPRDPATLYALYRAEADPEAFGPTGSRPRSFAAVDIETAGPPGKAGFRPEQGHIIEVGVVRLDGTGTETGTYQTLVRPGPGAEETFRTGAVDIHHIAWEDVADAPTWEQVRPDVAASMDRATLLAHNVSFERRWFEHHLPDLDPRTPAVDTLHQAQRNFGDLDNHRLATVCEHLGVEYTDGHRAMHDAKVAGQLFFAARAHIEDRYVSDPRFAGLPDPRHTATA